ncbi:Mitogen-activated protein kinase kinase kinase 20 [Linum grandiflorum]
MAAVGWSRGNRLGKGAFGEVFLAQPTNPNLPMMAVKSAPVDDAASLLAEFDILSKFRQAPGIIQCIGEDLSDDLPGGETYNLFLEYAAGGSLSDLIADYGGCGIPERDVKVGTLSLLKALSSVHAAGYTYCDIKPDNVLVFPDDDGFYQLKIADFGLAMEIPDPDSTESNLRGTARYLPPEMIISGTVSPAMDIWALGCTVVEMLTGEHPFSCLKGNTAVMWRIANGDQPEIPECLSDEGKDFLRKCFDSRWSADMLISHPFVSGRSLNKGQRTTAQQELHQMFEQALAALES